MFKLKSFFLISDLDDFSFGKFHNLISPNTLEYLNMTIKMKDVPKELYIELSKAFNDSSLEEDISDKNIVKNLNKLVHKYLLNELNINFNNQQLEEQEVNSILNQYLNELIDKIEVYEGREINKTEIIDSFCLKFQNKKSEDKDFNIDVNDLFQRE